MRRTTHIPPPVFLTALFVLPSCVSISPAKNETAADPIVADASVTDIPAPVAAEKG